MERGRSRGRYDRGPAFARIGVDGLPAFLPGLYRPHRLSAGDLWSCRSSTRRVRGRSTATWDSCSSGFILEDARQRSASFTGAPGATDPGRRLDAQFRRLATFLTSEPLGFSPPRSWRDRTAPTEVDPWRGRLLVGEVHDENTWALGGVAGHAGLFGTVAAVGAFARAVLATLDGAANPGPDRDHAPVHRSRQDVPGSSRALGWDTMLPTSSCGTRLSPTAIGHTGFTGTSLWIDWERDLYIVLLTNRVHPTRENDAIRRLRRACTTRSVEAFDRSFR